MARTTIDFGIDLGTTNSSISVAQGSAAEVLRNTSSEETTPSAVWCNGPGNYVVGRSAYDAAARDPQNVALRYKRFIGEKRPFHFPRGNESLTPDQLSAKVIAELLAGAEKRFGEVPTAAVITTPANFELHQCQATERAGRLAGLETVLLLQEPVAAAQAYGFQDETERAYWLVYDLGAGTFDVALLRIADGLIQVVGQRGDNDLGGLRFDEGIVRQVLAPYLKAEHRVDLAAEPQSVSAHLRSMAERAKVALSSPAPRSALCMDAVMLGSGRSVYVECALSRAQLEAVMAPDVLRSVRICRDLLAEHRLTPGEVARVVLVGGPTHSAYLREALSDPVEGLGIALEHRLDPMTVVSQGAAIWAGSQPLPRAAGRGALPASAFFISFPNWRAVGDDDDLEAYGRVEAADGVPLNGYTVEFANEGSTIGWRSGRIALAEGGGFRAVLHAEKGVANLYRAELRNPRGALCPSVTQPERLVHTRGRLVEGAQLTKSFGVALADGAVAWLAHGGTVLPIKATVSLSNAWEVLRDRAGDRIVIPLFEGESDDAARNHEVGALVIPAGDLPRDLPASTEIILTVEIDASRLVKGWAYLPTIDRTFERVIDLENTLPPDPADVARRASLALERLDGLEKEVSKADAAPPPALERARADGLREEVEQALDGLENSPDDAWRCDNKSRDLQRHLDAAEAELLPMRVERTLAWAREVIGHYGTAAEREALRSAEARLSQALAADPPDADTLRDLRGQAHEVAFQALDRADILPIWQFEWFEAQIYDADCRAEALHLIELGRQARRNGDITELRKVNWALFKLRPRDDSMLGSTVMRRYGR